AGRINSGVNSLQQAYLRLAIVKKTLVSALIFIISIGIFYLFRNSTHLLGDGLLRGDELTYGFGYLPLSTEPLTSILHYLFYKLANPLFGVQNHASIQIFSCILGGAFILLAINIFKPKKESGFSPLLAVIGISGVQFFFGYVESYIIPYIGLLIFIWLSYRYFSTGKAFAAACIVYMIAFISHFSIIFTLPAFLVFMFFGLRNPEVKASQKTAAIVSLIIMAAVFVYFHYIYVPAFGHIEVGFLLPFTPDGYWVFDPAHLLDILNNLLLSSTFGLLLLPVIIKHKLWNNINIPAKIFSILLICGSLGFLFFIDPKLGFARDWDLFVPASAVFVIIAIYLVYKAKEIVTDYRSEISIAMLLPIIFSASFVAVNQNLESSYRRFEYILQFHSERSAFGYESLGGHYKRFYRNKEDLRRAIENYKRAFELLKNPRYLTNIASVYDVYFNSYTDETLSRRFIDSIEYYAEKALEYNDSLTNAYEYLSMASLYRNDLKKALNYTDIVLEYMDPKDQPEFRFRRAGILLRMNDYAAAEKEFLKILELDPDFGKAYIMLGSIYRMNGQREKAIQYFNEYLRRFPDGDFREEVESNLRNLRY
ncbi:MAG: tetratricopeptide repeat protein, partial [candidate division Zixibacteria bacterium]|nr:tetratricopeptide repeat protein [candidate division Zixibacteria bacterium]NIS44457.1 tetratricopeptide repeat protein [candidate division Zixibacteria bacterium]NIT51278.1 tetratricopeptide repeat protein [candidate division Zixibacteria bacterium]NIU12463.1 tetratricopeptide repeat protein [candidate division Zixibacteria bacterium]NIV04641.1 tetratricopeptide repeat protein [candidate division Zixibacteria bacterium]